MRVEPAGDDLIQNLQKEKIKAVNNGLYYIKLFKSIR
jgi:hypothetical protein